MEQHSLNESFFSNKLNESELKEEEFEQIFSRKLTSLGEMMHKMDSMRESIHALEKSISVVKTFNQDAETMKECYQESCHEINNNITNVNERIEEIFNKYEMMYLKIKKYEEDTIENFEKLKYIQDEVMQNNEEIFNANKELKEKNIQFNEISNEITDKVVNINNVIAEIEEKYTIHSSKINNDRMIMAALIFACILFIFSILALVLALVSGIYFKKHNM